MDPALLDELPAEYRRALTDARVTPLWPILRDQLPNGLPVPTCAPTHWRYEHIRPLLLRAGELTPVERAERRVLVLSGDGYGEAAPQATPSIYLGLQLLLPGERAPSHKHTPSAVRLAVEGSGALTLVEGEQLPMMPGDLVLTPKGEWHEHLHQGDEPVIWLDALDLPLIVYLEASYSQQADTEGPEASSDKSGTDYIYSGLRPSPSCRASTSPHPLHRYPWDRTKQALQALVGAGTSAYAEIDYINPETGGDVLATLGFSALSLGAGHTHRPARRSPPAAFHVVEGSGRSSINGQMISWHQKDAFCVPGYAALAHEATDESYLIRIDEAPLHKKLGIYEELTGA